MIPLLLANWRWVLMVVLLAVVGVQSWRVDLCKKGRLKDQVAAEATRVRLEGSLAAQNEAIAQLGKESKDRKAAAEKALQKAKEGTQKARSEAERLKTLAQAPRGPEASKECPAGDAVARIREGLK